MTMNKSDSPSDGAAPGRPRLGLALFAAAVVGAVVGVGTFQMAFNHQRDLFVEFLEGRFEHKVSHTVLEKEAEIAQLVTDRILQTDLEKRLLERPEIIINALQAYERAQAQKAATVAAETISHARQEDSAVVIGPATASVTLVSFSDYNCPYCRKAAPALLKALEGGDVRIVFREFPVITPDSRGVSQVAYALKSQGLYLDFYKKAEQHKGNLNTESALRIAEEIGADLDKVKTDMDSTDTIRAIQASLDIGQELNVTGTPTFLVGNEVVRGYVNEEQLAQIVSRVRDQAVNAAPANGR